MASKGRKEFLRRKAFEVEPQRMARIFKRVSGRKASWAGNSLEEGREVWCAGPFREMWLCRGVRGSLQVCSQNFCLGFPQHNPIPHLSTEPWSLLLTQEVGNWGWGAARRDGHQ